MARIFHSLIILAALLVLSVARANTEVVARFPYSVTKMAYDAARERIYLTSKSANSVIVLDAKTVSHIATVSVGSSPQGLSITPNGTHLYVGLTGATINSIVAIDLSTLSLDTNRTINTGLVSVAVACAPDDVLYVLSGTNIRQYDTSTKQLLATLSGVTIYSGDMAITPDFSALYYQQFGLSPSRLYKFDLGLSPPTVSYTNSGSSGNSLAISHNSAFVVAPNGAPYSIPLYSNPYFPGTYGEFETGSYPRLAAFSRDDSKAYTYNGSNSVQIYSTSTLLPLGTIALSGGVNSTTSVAAIQADTSDTLIFLGSTNQLLVAGNPLNPLTLEMDEPSINTTDGIFSTSFRTFRGRNYAIQTSVDLVTWTNLGNLIRGDGEVHTVQRTFEPGQPRRFFRIQKPNVP